MDAPYTTDKETNERTDGRTDGHSVHAGSMGAKNDARTYGPYVRSILTAHTYG